MKYRVMLFDNEMYHSGPIFDNKEDAQKLADDDIMKFDYVKEIEE